MISMSFDELCGLARLEAAAYPRPKAALEFVKKAEELVRLKDSNFSVRQLTHQVAAVRAAKNRASRTQLDLFRSSEDVAGEAFSEYRAEVEKLVALESKDPRPKIQGLFLDLRRLWGRIKDNTGDNYVRKLWKLCAEDVVAPS